MQSVSRCPVTGVCRRWEAAGPAVGLAVPSVAAVLRKSSSPGSDRPLFICISFPHTYRPLTRVHLAVRWENLNLMHFFEQEPCLTVPRTLCPSPLVRRSSFFTWWFSARGPVSGPWAPCHRRCSHTQTQFYANWLKKQRCSWGTTHLPHSLSSENVQCGGLCRAAIAATESQCACASPEGACSSPSPPHQPGSHWSAFPSLRVCLFWTLSVVTQYVPLCVWLPLPDRGFGGAATVRLLPALCFLSCRARARCTYAQAAFRPSTRRSGIRRISTAALL